MNIDLMKMQLEMQDMLEQNKLHMQGEEGGASSEEGLKKLVEELAPYEKMELRELTQTSEILFMEEHICNNNLKVKDKDEAFLEQHELVK